MKRLSLLKTCVVFVFCAATAIGSSAQVFITLHSFAGPDGATPFSGLVRGADGNFYATASSGGASGDGTVFKITPQGALTVLHNFSGGDGYTPYGVLVQGSDGNLYGTTTRGGGSGTVFRLYPVPACSNCRIK